MVQLLLLRHAKSSWTGSGLNDVDRPLAPRGVKAASLVGERMRAASLFPDQILCSAALRARETLLGVLPAILPYMPSTSAIALSAALYGAAPDDYMAVIAGQARSARTLLLIGHNPATEVTAGRLVGQGDETAMTAMASKFPTAALAVIDFEVDDWAAIGPGSGRLVDFVRAG